MVQNLQHFGSVPRFLCPNLTRNNSHDIVTNLLYSYIQLTMAETIPSTRSHKLTLVIKLYSVLRVIIFITGIALISIA